VKKPAHDLAPLMSLLKSAAKVGGLTLISRLLGFVRDQLIAFTLGTGLVAEAFFVAQRLPNLFRALFAEGAFNNAFVPQFVKKQEVAGQAQAFVFGRQVLSVVFTWMLVFCAAAMIFMPWLMPVLAPGFRGSAEKLELATELTRICFPYLGMMSLTALFGGILNSLNRFSAPAAAPILLNIVVIGFTLAAWHLGLGNSAATGRFMAWAVTASGVAQLLLLLTAAHYAGAQVVPSLPRLTQDVKRVLVLSVPGLISGGITQINLLIATMLATGFSGGVAFLYYADRLFQLPLGLIGVAIGVVLLPTLSRKLRAGDAQGARDSQNRALELSLFLTLPAAAALVMIGRPILHTVFEHGEFTRADTFNVAPVLAAFAAGLPAFTLTKIFQPGFFAREDTKTPMHFAIIAVVVNIAASLVLSRYFEYVGIAIATSIAAWTNAGLLMTTAVRRGDFAADERLKKRLPRILVSLLVMGAVMAGILHLLEANYAQGAGFQAAVLGLIALIGGGSLSYFAAAHLTNAFRLGELKAGLRR
jgi:putative peptidoglycan lipid II flippase